MKIQDALDYRLDIGKHSGEKLGDVLSTERGFNYFISLLSVNTRLEYWAAIITALTNPEIARKIFDAMWQKQERLAGKSPEQAAEFQRVSGPLMRILASSIDLEEYEKEFVSYFGEAGSGSDSGLDSETEYEQSA